MYQLSNNFIKIFSHDFNSALEYIKINKGNFPEEKYNYYIEQLEKKFL